MTHKMLVVYFALGTSLAVLAQVPTLLQPTTLTGTVPDNDATVKRARNVACQYPTTEPDRHVLCCAVVRRSTGHALFATARALSRKAA